MCRIGSAVASRIDSNQPCAVLQGMAMAPQPAASSPRMPRSRAGSGSAPPASLAAVRGGTRGSDQSTVGICVLVLRRRGQQGQPHHELRAGQRPHAAQHAQYLVDHHRTPSLPGCSVPDQGSRMKLALAVARDIIARMSGSSCPRSAVSASIGQKNSCGCATWLRAKPS